MQDVVDKFIETTKKLDMKINNTKTKIMLFNKSKFEIIVNIEETMVENVTSYKYLVVIIDKNLTFNKHIQSLKSRVNDRLNMFKVLNGIKAGAHPQTMLNIYEALITNLIMYGASVYGTCCKSLSNLLEASYRKALRIATGCSKTTSIYTLAAIATKEPLPIKREYMVKKGIGKYFKSNSLTIKNNKQH